VWLLLRRVPPLACRSLGPEGAPSIMDMFNSLMAGEFSRVRATDLTVEAAFEKVDVNLDGRIDRLE
jgi:hypothetical protein